MTVVPTGGASADVIKAGATSTGGIQFTVNTVAGCAAPNGPNVISFSYQANGAGTVTTDIQVTVTNTQNLSSGLTASGVTVQCTLNGGTYTPGPAQTISVTSSATGGTAFTVNTTVGVNNPSYVVLNQTGANPVTSPSGTATGTAVTFTIAFAGPASTTACNGANWTSNGTHTFNLQLVPSNPVSPVVNVPITLSIVTTSPLTVVPQSGPTFSLTYQKNSGIVQSQAGYLTSNTPNVFFGVNTNNVSWLSVSPASGTGNASNTTVRFSTTTSANSLPPGTYTGVVYFTVSGYADKPVTITLLVTNAPATLSVTTAAGAGATTVNLTYVLGGAYPTTTITVLSTDSPIAYTTKSAGPLAPIIQPNEATGLAYSFGTNVGISFNQLLYATLAPGSTLSGTVTFTWGPVSTPSNTVVTINLHVASASALLSSIFPASIPTATTGTATITLNGTGFVNSSDNTAATRVGIVSNGALNTDNNLSWVVNSPTNITLTITVPTSSDCPNIPMSPTVLCNGVIGGPVYLGVVNGTQNLSPTGTATLVVGSYPIILGVTSSSSFTETGAGNLQTFAPYDMISIFGANFCSQGNVATNCAGGANPTILPGVPTAFPDLIYPTSLTPDTNSLAPRLLTVTLHPHGLLSPSWPAPLLFATNGQINALVPAAVGVSPYVGTGTVDIIVTFGAQSSAAFNVSIAASDPGMFTIGSSGQGPAAALSFPSYSLVSATHPALMRSGVATSDTIQLYVTGLGLPPSSWNATTTGSNTPITNCVAAVTGTGNYMSWRSRTWAQPKSPCRKRRKARFPRVNVVAASFTLRCRLGPLASEF